MSGDARLTEVNVDHAGPDVRCREPDSGAEESQRQICGGNRGRNRIRPENRSCSPSSCKMLTIPPSNRRRNVLRGVDIAVELEGKWDSDGERNRHEKERIKFAYASGRTFSNFYRRTELAEI
jgi:hypothetical protein